MMGDTAPKRQRIVVDILAVVTALCLAVSGWALISRGQQIDAARQDNQHTWHAVICAIEKSVASDDTVEINRKIKFLRFYDNLLVNSVGTEPCHILPRR